MESRGIRQGERGREERVGGEKLRVREAGKG